MANLMDYLDWRGDLTLAVSPFNEVDALILAELSFVDFDGIVPPPEIGRGLPLCEAAEAFFARHGGRDVDMGVLVPDGISQMLRKLMASSRFRNMTLNGYTALLDDAVEQQFAALTIDLGNGSIYISFRGTDDTIVGWKEDLNMGFLEEIPSQKQSVAYVARMARQYPDKTIRIGGHSKGGNLAVYSAVKSDGAIQERIVAVHNNDGPGFAWDISETAGHKRIASRIHTVLPQTSVVGMLMEHEKHYQVVHSTYDGLYQHDGFSWQVLGTQFVHLDDVSREGKLVDEALSAWADSLNTQQREALADALYSVFTASGAKTLSDLNEEKLKSAAAMLKTYKNLDRETRRMVTEALMLFFRLSTKSFVLDTQEESSREIENIRRKISEQYQKLLAMDEVKLEFDDGQHIGAVIQNGIGDGGGHGHAHEFLGHILCVDRHAGDEVNDKAAEAANERRDGKLGIVVVLGAQKTREANSGVSKGIVEDDGDPAHSEALGKEILERTEGKTGEQTPGCAPTHSEEDQRDHHEVDRAAEAAERKADGDLDVAQNEREGDADAAFSQAAGAGVGGRVAHVRFLLLK